MPMIGARFYTQLDASQMRNDVIEEDLAKVCNTVVQKQQRAGTIQSATFLTRTHRLGLGLQEGSSETGCFKLYRS